MHGDDFTALGVDASIDNLEAGLKASFEIKVHGRIGGPLPLKEMRILNRIVTLTEKGILYEADPRHAELLVRNMSVSNPWRRRESKMGTSKIRLPRIMRMHRAKTP